MLLLRVHQAEHLYTHRPRRAPISAQAQDSRPQLTQPLGAVGAVPGARDARGRCAISVVIRNCTMRPLARALACLFSACCRPVPHHSAPFEGAATAFFAVPAFLAWQLTDRARREARENAIAIVGTEQRAGARIYCLRLQKISQTLPQARSSRSWGPVQKEMTRAAHPYGIIERAAFGCTMQSQRVMCISPSGFRNSHDC